MIKPKDYLKILLVLVVLLLLIFSVTQSMAQTFWVNNGYTYIDTNTIINITHLRNNASGKVDLQGTLNLTGSIVNNSSTNVFEGEGYVNLIGSNQQEIKGNNSVTFPNVKFHNSGHFDILVNIQIDISANLLDGILFIDDSKQMTFDTDAIYSGSGANAYVDGKVTKIGNSDFIFPVGDNGKFARIAVSSLGASSQTFTAEYFKAGHFDYANFNTTNINDVSSMEYWNLNRSAGSTGVNVSLYWDDGSWSGIGSIDDVYMVHYNNEWAETGMSPTRNGNSFTGFITDGPINDFSPFTFGSIDNDNTPLPVEILSFNATPNANFIDVIWSTSSHRNTDYFEIQRSIDGKIFDVLGSVSADGNSNVIKNYLFEDIDIKKNQLYYYRLKMVDFDGFTDYSTIQTAVISNEFPILIYPNPTNDLINLNGLPNNSIVEIRNINGLLVKSVITKEKSKIDLKDLTSGVYFIQIFNNHNIVLTDRIIKL